jgi:type IV pilus assembly protein PilV
MTSFLKQGGNSQVQGFTLIEVLISLTLLAVGMLGMTSLQNKALQFNKAAFVESQAQFLINDMVERIRANPNSALYGLKFTETPDTPTVQCDEAPCTSNQMAQWDLSEWRAMVRSGDYLPEGESEIVFNNISYEFTVSIRYDWSQLGGIDLTEGKRTVSLTARIQ